MDIKGLLQRVQDKKARLDAARAAVAVLEPDEHDELLAEMVETAQARTTKIRPAPKAPKMIVTVGRPSLLASGKTKKDVAEDLVRSKPGITTKEIAAVIDQSAKVASTTLNSIKEKRGTIENRDGGWYPVTKRSSDVTVRELIIQAMRTSVRPLRTGEIHDAVRLLDPTVNKNSVSAQVHRMVHMTPPLLEKVGEDRLGPLHRLAAVEPNPKANGGLALH